MSVTDRPSKDNPYTVLACKANNGIVNSHSNRREWFSSEQDAVEKCSRIFQKDPDAEIVVVKAIAFVKPVSAVPVTVTKLEESDVQAKTTSRQVSRKRRSR